MQFDIVTIFPEALESYLDTSILRRALLKNLIKINFYNPRDFVKDKHRVVDDKPYGGGAGMVMMAEPILRAVDKIRKKKSRSRARKMGAEKVIILSAKGRQFNQSLAYGWAKKYDQLILISGRYEGIDERVRLALKAEEVSVGPYVLTDGEVASGVLISAVSRLIPGVIRLESLVEESHFNLLKEREAKGELSNGLEYPHYTRPETLKYKGKKYVVPKVLLSGDHRKIGEWRSAAD